MARQSGPGWTQGPEPLYSAIHQWMQVAPGSKMGGDFPQPRVRRGGKLGSELSQRLLHPGISQFRLTPASPQSSPLAPGTWPLSPWTRTRSA